MGCPNIGDETKITISICLASGNLQFVMENPFIQITIWINDNP